MRKPILIIFLVLFADQALKFYIKLTMTMGEEIPVLGNWFLIHFTENPGMAFGLQFAGEWGKIALSIFRILAATAIGFYLWKLTRDQTPFGPILGISLIMAGALGNIIDSCFYGLIFSESTWHTVAKFLPEGGGYAGFLHGHVVDMFYFPIIMIQKSQAPAWMPDFLFGPDDYFIFFRPVFNIADASITIGVLWLLLFERKFLGRL